MLADCQKIRGQLDENGHGLHGNRQENGTKKVGGFFKRAWNIFDSISIRVNCVFLNFSKKSFCYNRTICVLLITVRLTSKSDRNLSYFKVIIVLSKIIS